MKSINPPHSDVSLDSTITEVEPEYCNQPDLNGPPASGPWTIVYVSAVHYTYSFTNAIHIHLSAFIKCVSCTTAGFKVSEMLKPKGVSTCAL